MGVLLLRWEISAMWNAILWVATFVQLGVAFGSTICQLIQGRRLHAMWVMVDGGSSFPRPFKKSIMTNCQWTSLAMRLIPISLKTMPCGR